MEEEEQLVSYGESADNLLNNNYFNKTVDNLVQSTFQAFVNSKLEDAEGRERTFAHYRALVDIVNTLRQQVSVRDEILAKREADYDNSKEDN